MSPSDIGSDHAPFSCVIINFNGQHILEKTIESLQALRTPPAEIILVDDGSTDRSVAFVKETYPDVVIEAFAENTARTTRLRNAGLRRASNRFVLVTDNDIIFEPDSIVSLSEALRRHADAAACTPIVLFNDGSGQVFLSGHDLHYLGWSVVANEQTLADLQARGDKIAAGCGIAMFDKDRMGNDLYFNEQLGLGWGDDGELHHRMRLYGKACYRVPTAIVYHQRIRLTHRVAGTVQNRIVFLMTNYATRSLLILAPALLLFEILLAIYALLSGTAGDYLAGWRAARREWPAVRLMRAQTQANRTVRDRDLLGAGPLDLRFKSWGGLGIVIQKTLNAFFNLYWMIARALL